MGLPDPDEVEAYWDVKNNPCYTTPYGFVWENISVERIASIYNTRVLRIKVDKTDVEIYVSPKGRSVRVWKNHKELK